MSASSYPTGWFTGSVRYTVVALFLFTLLTGGPLFSQGDTEPPGGPPPEASLAITLDASSIRIAGLNPGSSAILVGATHETEDFHAKLARVVEVLIDDDQDGEAVLDLQNAVIPPLSVWLAADLQSGSTGFAIGDVDFAPETLNVPTLGTEAPGGPESLLQFASMGSVEAVMVRLGLGAWAISGHDAGQGESSELPDGKLDLELQQFEALIGFSDPPESFSTTDLILAIEPRSLAWIIGQPASGGQQ